MASKTIWFRLYNMYQAVTKNTSRSRGEPLLIIWNTTSTMLPCLFSRKASLPTISTKQTKGVSNVERTSLKGLNVDLKNLDIDKTPMNLDLKCGF